MNFKKISSLLLVTMLILAGCGGSNASSDNSGSGAADWKAQKEEAAKKRKQEAALKYLIKRIRKKCKNANQIIRHYDINGKQCPLRYILPKKWEELRRRLEA